jgi:hypothetical protein
MLILHDPTSAKRWACVVEGGFPLGVFQANLLGLPVTRARVHHSAPGSRTRERPRHPSVEDLGPLWAFQCAYSEPKLGEVWGWLGWDALSPIAISLAAHHFPWLVGSFRPRKHVLPGPQHRSTSNCWGEALVFWADWSGPGEGQDLVCHQFQLGCQASKINLGTNDAKLVKDSEIF